MEISKKEYSDLTDKKSPNSSTAKNCTWAFFVGGFICMIGQALTEFFNNMGMTLPDSRAWTSIVLIFFGVLLTAMGIYGKMAKKAGAGTLVPITGFANSVAAPAMEYKSEGYISGVGAKMFTIAGPVIVYGTLAGVLYGIILVISDLL